MKKNKMMRLASAMMVMTLMTTSVISGTFAKYVTSDSASDSARVAKWGITVMASGELFGTDYSKHVSDTEGDRIVAATSTSVSSSNVAEDIVAPGTKNEKGFKLTLTGNPEVAYKIEADTNSVDIEDIFLSEGDYGVMVKAVGLNAASNVVGLYTEASGVYTEVTTGVWDKDTTYYELHDAVTVSENVTDAGKFYPINWTVANTGNAAAITTTKDLVAIATAMKDGIKVATRNAKEDISASYVLTWEWPFDTTVDANANDGVDTILGNLAAGELPDAEVVKFKSGSYTNDIVNGEDYNLDINFGFKVTVTQLD